MNHPVLHLGDCLVRMREAPAESADSFVTDPPYGIRFMGKSWDGDDIEKMMQRKMRKQPIDRKSRKDRKSAKPEPALAAGTYDLTRRGSLAFQEFSREWAAEAFRILKPGGWLVSFSSTRTYHRMVCGIEDAGFEIRDQLGWAFGSGFPKSKNIGGLGTALKPAWEPICLARKPIVGNVEKNFAQYGTGVLRIDDCRVPFANEADANEAMAKNQHETFGTGARPNHGIYGKEKRDRTNWVEVGRWPPNIIHDGSEEVLGLFPVSASRGHFPARDSGAGNLFKAAAGTGGHRARSGMESRDLAPGSTARLFYCAKASVADRDAGLEFERTVPVARSNGAQAALSDDDAYSGGSTDIGLNKVQMRANHHPTVKPTELMRWLVRLVTPAGGTVWDPFMGSGSTGRAALLEGLCFVGCERQADYMELARKRIAEAQGELFAHRG